MFPCRSPFFPARPDAHDWSTMPTVSATSSASHPQFWMWQYVACTPRSFSKLQAILKLVVVIDPFPCVVRGSVYGHPMFVLPCSI